MARIFSRNLACAIDSPDQRFPITFSSSAITDGSRVYAYFGSTGLVALDFDGKARWHVKFGPINLYHGPGGAPLLYKDQLILFQEQTTMGRPGSSRAEPGIIVAVNKDTGTILWREERNPQ